MFSILCSVFTAVTFTPAGFGCTDLLLWDKTVLCTHVFQQMFLTVTQPPLEPHVSFKSPLFPLLCSHSVPLYFPNGSIPLCFLSICLCCQQWVCTQKREKIFSTCKCEKVPHIVEFTTPRWQFRDKRCWNGGGIYLFMYCYKNPGKQMCFVSNKILKHERIRSATVYLLYPNKRAAL